MMDKGVFRRFRETGILWTGAAALGAVVFSVGCGTAIKEPDGSETTYRLAGAEAEISSKEAIDGSIVLVTLKILDALETMDVQGEFGEIKLPFFLNPDLGNGIYQSVLGVPFGYRPGPAVIKLKWKKGEEEKHLEIPLVIVDGKYPLESLKVDPKHVNPSKKDMIRIRREITEIGAIYRSTTRQKHWNGKFTFPITSPVTSIYGSRRLFNGEERSAHLGIDLKAPTGTIIRPAAPGVVVLAKDLYFSGKTVLIDHGYGIFTLYAHMSKLQVKRGQQVKADTLLGLSGKTGRASGPHLHWGAVVLGAKVNPLELLRVMQ
jgi:hypothetical protein